ncbi:MAG: aldo/keto reductase [Myxococcales bacterium]|nr:aldo/keto reductase [Myxococcales bacterium]
MSSRETNDTLGAYVTEGPPTILLAALPWARYRSGVLELTPWARRRTPGERPQLALGTMNFGKRTPAPEAERIIHRALERGLSLFDTANAYCDGASEQILGRALAGRRETALIATKVGFGRQGGSLEGLSKTRVLAAADESRKRLGVDVIDLYYLHVPDHATRIEETLEAIATLLSSGTIRAFGISNYASWQILEIFHACDRANIPRPIIAQQIYNLLIRQLELEYFRFASKYGLHTTVYNPLAGGLLTSRYAATAEIPKGSRFDKNKLYQGRYWSERMLALAEEMGAIASAEGLSRQRFAYAWLAASRDVDSILVGPGTLAHLDEAIDAVATPIGEESRERADEAFRRFQGTETSYAR